MNINYLEERLKEIREKKLSVKENLKKYKQKFAGMENVIGTDWWYLNNLENNIINTGEQLDIDLEEGKHIYLSYLERNVDFSQPPSHFLEITEGILNCEMIGDATSALKVNLYIIGYKENQKISLVKAPLNKKMKVKLDLSKMNRFRIAIKLEGSGVFSLKEIKLGLLTIPGFFQEKFLLNANRVEPNINLTGKFHQIIDIKPFELHVPAIFSHYIDVNKESMDCKLPQGSYAYLQGSKNHALFEISNKDVQFKIEPLNFYEIGFRGEAKGDIRLDLIALGYNKENAAVDVKLIECNTSNLIQFKNEVERVKFIFRVQGFGSLMDLKIGINSKPRKATNITSLPLNEEAWFVAKKSDIKVSEKSNVLTIFSGSKPTSTKTKYVSYSIKNNSFGKVPDFSAFNIARNHYYELKVNATISGEGRIVPIVITYSHNGKEDIIPLKLNEINKIKFKDSVECCRIAFKINGHAELAVQEFKVEEYPIIETSGNMQWIDSKEPSLLGVLPRNEISNIKMAAIFDEFTKQCFAHECNLITFTPDNWLEVLTENRPDFLMVESAWRGNNGTWTKKVQYQGEESVSELRELLSWCKENNIPTIFWNKEDPVHYEHFLGTAKMFDFVFTTDSNMIPKYKEACGHEQVFCLQFAAQPAIHNPITIGEREEAASFAGSYYAKHVERSVDMLRIFEAVKPFGLAIFDRNYEKVKQGLLKNNQYPEDLQPFIRGSLKYYEIDNAYKGYKVVININTVKNSPTMFARRVYESLACGTPIISNYSEGIENIFGDIVYLSENEQKVKEDIKNLFTDKFDYRRRVIRGIREVLMNHTYSVRLKQIIDVLQLPYTVNHKKVVVISKAETIEEINKIVTEYQKQTYQHKRLILISEADQAISFSEDSSIEIFNLQNFIDTYSNLLEIKDCDYISVMRPDIYYNENYLLDLMMATKYAPWEMITVVQKEELIFEQVNKADLDYSAIKSSVLSLFSSYEAIKMLTEIKDVSFLKKRGGRILGITID
ncbi:hypothetical protein D1B31_15895 [Neobacillus notoginsengisoli]|uniref:Spore protein YkvP/CgeB glycosyl transferase-like domain-containing protein n=1 Tax=Neobacillus notoginsengisoli TaxID=1578198 RepID=A0A417YRC2_9BACI|nr:glycosyltransferase [Neobacillus notoginsengisoli]RHW37249.1 hypothetical protein D1B31_15895 [Neobacillus notoginsengisoli]